MIINESANFRKFNKDDWMGYSGAIASSDGKLPLIAESDDFVIIISVADYNDDSISVTVMTDKYENKYKEFKSYDKAMYVAKNILKLANNSVDKLNNQIKSWKGY